MIKAKAKELGLDAPDAYWIVDDATLSQITGGCGPRSSGNFGILDKILGLSIKPACGIHDFEYGVGGTEADRAAADNRFLCNMLKIINKEPGFALFRMYRRYRAVTYYNAVVEMGASFFGEDNFNV